MKNLLIAAVGALSIASAIPAVAGPDMQVIEHGRQVKREQMRDEVQMQQQMQGMAGQSHAETSPEMRAKQEKMMKNCAEMMQKPVQ